MSEQQKFMEALTQLAVYAQETGNVLTKTEVEESFRDMSLSEQQFDLIYRYLFEKKITIQGIRLELPAQEVSAQNAAVQEEPDFEPHWMSDGAVFGEESGEAAWEEQPGESAEYGEAGESADTAWPFGTEETEAAEYKSKAGSAAEEREDARYLRLYLEELENLPAVTEEERLALVMRLLEGEEAALEPLLNATLCEVVEIARTCQGRGALLEDLIQEGNIGLLQALKELTGRKQQKDPLRWIHEYVQYAVEQYLEEQLTGAEAEEQIAAKLGLLHEAAEYLAGENGTLPSVRELAEFTRLSEDEIAELARLSKDADFIGGAGTSADNSSL